ncbi:MAG: hypothetical protein WAO69_08440 [Aestuariivita sp.]|uniref:hypothetical protein n=1 Tax=Aestuariivita sp. TaxID=1872407 RepID=UPI003BAEE25F
MDTKRLAAHAPRTRALAQDLADLQGPCLGCPGCEGLCLALIEAVTLPDAILGKNTAR